MEQKAFDKLVSQAQLGDKDSMDQLVDLVIPRLKSYLLRVTLDEELTNDLVQETLIRVVKSLGALRKIECFWPWLFRIASNQFRDNYRKQKKRKEVHFSAIDNEFDDKNGKVSKRLPDEIKAVIFSGIAKLPPNSAALFLFAVLKTCSIPR